MDEKITAAVCEKSYSSKIPIVTKFAAGLKNYKRQKNRFDHIGVFYWFALCVLCLFSQLSCNHH